MGAITTTMVPFKLGTGSWQIFSYIIIKSVNFRYIINPTFVMIGDNDS